MDTAAPVVQTVNEVISPVQTLINSAVDFLVQYSFQVVGALIIILIGLFAARWVEKVISGICRRRNFDVTLSKFLARGAQLTVLGFAFLISLGKFGITIAPFIAAIGATAFGLTFAIQGPLSNYAAGLTIILARPFIVGDTIEVAGAHGIVEEVGLGATRLVNEDGVKILIPNKHIVGEVIRNSNHHEVVEARIGISYSDDPHKAVEAIHRVLDRFSEIARQPPTQIGIHDFGDSSINIAYRYWIPSRKRFQTKHAVNLAVFEALKAAKITIPFPQREVRLLEPAKK